MSLLNLSAIIKALWSLIFSLALNNVAAQSTGNEINYFKVVTGRKRQTYEARNHVKAKTYSREYKAGTI